MVRTHDEALDLLRYAALGARVEVERIPGSPSAARYAVSVDGVEPHLATYSLPVLAEPLARHARTLADRALAARRGTLGGTPA